MPRLRNGGPSPRRAAVSDPVSPVLEILERSEEPAPPTGLPTDGRTVLVVDDDPRIRALLEEILSGEGYRVLTAPDGYIAAGTVERERPDLVLADVLTPQLDGVALAGLLRGRPEAPPVVLMSASVNPRDPALPFLAKPFDLPKVLATVAEYVGGPPPRASSLPTRLTDAVARAGLDPAAPRDDLVADLLAVFAARGAPAEVAPLGVGWRGSVGRADGRSPIERRGSSPEEALARCLVALEAGEGRA